MMDRTHLDPRWPRRRLALHEKEFTRGAIRITLHYHRAILKMRQQHMRNIRVILNQISLGDFQFRPEEFCKIGKFDFASAELQFDLLNVLRDFDPTAHSLCARRRRVFGGMIITMCSWHLRKVYSKRTAHDPNFSFTPR